MKTLQYLLNVSSLKLDASLCTGCRLCIMVCPHAVFEMDSKKVRIVDIDDCMECGACVQNCQFNALSVKVGVGCAAAVINGILSNSEPSCDCYDGNKNSCC